MIKFEFYKETETNPKGLALLYGELCNAGDQQFSVAMAVDYENITIEDFCNRYLLHMLHEIMEKVRHAREY